MLTRDDKVYVVFTNYNPYGYRFAYLKYVFTGEGLWKGYERVLKRYGVKNVLNLAQEFSYEPCFGVTFPVVKLSEVVAHFRPLETTRRLLEGRLLQSEAYELLEEVGTDNVGIGGSYMLGISHSGSDLDLVVYGERRAFDFLEGFKGGVQDEEWIREASENYSIDINVIRSIYDVRVRGVYKGLKYSVSFVDPTPLKPCDEVCKKLGPFEGEIEIESNEYPALLYPSRARVVKGVPDEVVSYEGVFSMALFKFKRLRLRGMLMECNGRRVLVLGDREVLPRVEVLL